jgi:hypothetical protein
MSLPRDPIEHHHGVSLDERRRRLPAAALLLVVLLALAAWAPWIDAQEAGRRAEAAFEQRWQGVVDGCGFNCQGCGPGAARRALFGWQVSLEYACGLLPADLPEYHQQAGVFVSFAGTVHGLPEP